MASLYLVGPGALDGVGTGDAVSLDGAEGRHAVSVARVRVGETLRLSDGRGTVVSGPVASTGKDTLTLTVDDVAVEAEPRPALVLVQALAKGGRDEMAVQAATEIGVDRIVPWSAARSVSRWDGAKVEKGRARWAAIAQEAAKQAVRSRVPSVQAPVTTAQLAAGAGTGGTAVDREARRALVVLDPVGPVRLSAWEPPADVEEIVLVVGPEGGIDGSEFDRLEAAGAVRVRLGDTVLRTSTAGPAALAVLQTRLGRW
ncbi:16S rRNA (uracil(1498)-N(3))-methyltransferase [Curtobacterium sp. MCSS17_007]|uniref:16S rRNA (uracil(1498)-N(3))-methyltransferase n=1 Tax=Curtobacterium sp. MCSS17_007 TaxID=2175646 RepID=UPI000DA73E22|nr:16S rRNA (uracil(1498)-N(3))-methyltransferase [Curtobacterium sp. MCSS17_007]WIE76885.1 16S rRNA (uracil(1498)-N(3))-methyltransferase [Curtobacterium sp. MCSS17_007]